MLVCVTYHFHGHKVSHQAKFNKWYEKEGFEDRRNNRNKGIIMYQKCAAQTRLNTAALHSLSHLDKFQGRERSS